METNSPLVFDLTVIGGGPAGYVAAIRASQLGMMVACVERDRLGGVCNNWGCIPTKALLAQAELYHQILHDAPGMGIQVDNVRFDFAKIIARSRSVSDSGAKGVGALFKKNKVTHLAGHARIVSKTSPFSIEIHDAPDHVAQTIQSKKILIATGAKPRELPGSPFDGQTILSAKQAMTLTEQPKSLIVVGAGAIGMEFAYFYHVLGTKVTVLEMQDRVLPIEDRECSAAVERSFRKLGIPIHTAHQTLGIAKTGDGVEVTIAPRSDEKNVQKLQAEKVLVAVGVQGSFDGLFAPGVPIETFKDHLKVDYRKPGATYETSLKDIYAVGDVIGPPWLAHVASEEAVVAVERLAGHHAIDVDYGNVPGCTYCQPQVASVGLTEDACKEQKLDYKVGKFPFMASGKARAIGATDGFVKMICESTTGEILGVHMVGQSVTELIGEICLARRLEATSDEIIATMHAHPTLSEAIHESALATQNRTLNF